MNPAEHLSKVHNRWVAIFALMGMLLVTGGASGCSEKKSVPHTSGSCDPLTSFNQTNFSTPTKIDNQWHPMVPGTQFTLEGKSDRGAGHVNHQVVFTITDLTKMINGVRSRVVYDVDTSEGQLSEAENAFFAQDNSGNVWNMGEYPEEYVNGKFTGAPSTWISGLEGSNSGIDTVGNPRVGDRAYQQGAAPSVDFLDCARVFRMGERSCVPVMCYDNVMVTEEWSPLDRGSGRQHKYHAPGVGIVQVGAVNDRENEILVLTKVEQITPAALAEIRQKSIDLDKHAYQVSKVYAQTPPVEPDR